MSTQLWDTLSRSGLGGGPELLPLLGVIDVEVAEGSPVESVDGDVIAIHDDGGHAAAAARLSVDFRVDSDVPLS